MSVYFVQPEGEPFVKIGYASRVFGRIGSLQVGHHRRLVLIGLMDGDWKAERVIHRRFAKAHVRGEWFNLTGEVLAFLDTLSPPPSMPSIDYEPFRPSEYDPEAPLVQAWFSKDFEDDAEMAFEWNMDADILRSELGESGRAHE